MKLLIALFLFFGGVSGAFAQAYIPIPDTLAVWTQSRTKGMMPVSFYENCQLFTAEKISVNSLLYTVLRASGVRGGSNIPTEISFSDKMFGLFRNDTIARKVYFKDSISSPEYMLYDFSLQQGDTFITWTDGMQWHNIIDTILEVEMFGAMHRQYVFSDHGNWIPGSRGSYIEGVGSLLGFGWPISIPYEPAEAYLECFGYNEAAYLFPQQQWYTPPTTSDSSCRKYNTVIPDGAAHNIIINYLSRQDCIQAEIQNTDLNNCSLMVFDVWGREVIAIPLDNKVSMIFTGHLQNGLYAWAVYSGNKPLLYGKMIK